MKCLVISAHPLKDSLCHSFKQQVIPQLEKMGHEVITEDLYDNQFQPALTEQERQAYYQQGNQAIDMSDEVKRLQEAEVLILIFPTWWFNFPAILKGWFDRVWLPGVAYDHASDYGPIKPRLHNLKETLNN